MKFRFTLILIVIFVITGNCYPPININGITQKLITEHSKKAGEEKFRQSFIYIKKDIFKHPVPKISDHYLPPNELFKTGKPVDELQKKPFENGGIFFLFLASFGILIFIRIASPDFLSELFKASVKENYLLTKLHKHKQMLIYNNVLLDIVFVLTLSVIIYEYFFFTVDVEFRIILAVVIAFYGIQLLVVYLFYNVFFGYNGYNLHLINLLVFNRILAIFLLPAVFLATYFPEQFHQTIHNCIIVFISIIFLVRTFRIFFQLKKAYSFNIFFIILYICVFEISLYFILIKEFSWFIK